MTQQILSSRLNRFDDLASIRGGEILLQCISLVEKSAVEEINNTLDTVSYPVTFFGITELPCSKTAFYCLFTNDMETLKYHLDVERDIEKVAWNGDRWDRAFVECYHRNNKHSRIEEHPYFTNMLWNRLTLLEVAILLNHEEAIQLLLKYQRRMWHKKENRKTSYLATGLALAKQFGRIDLVDRLTACTSLPSQWNINGMNK